MHAKTVAAAILLITSYIQRCLSEGVCSLWHAVEDLPNHRMWCHYVIQPLKPQLQQI